MEKLGRLPFSLTAFLLAPFPAPFLYCVLLTFDTGDTGGTRLLAFFLIGLGVGLVISYLGTAALVVCLWFIAQVRPVTKGISVLTGIALAAIGYLPFVFMEWKSSGPDSGPPIESFATALLRSFSDPFSYTFPAAGLVTAFFYDFLARRSAKADDRKPHTEITQ